MKNTKIAAAVMAITLGIGTLASAQPRDGRDGRDGRDDRRGGPQQTQQWNRGGPDHGGPGRGGPDRGRPGFDRRDGHGAGPDHGFYRGDRLPPQYRSRQYVVEDWRGHRLSAPPRGQQWVQMGGDYVLVAIATGVITSLILNH